MEITLDQLLASREETGVFPEGTFEKLPWKDLGLPYRHNAWQGQA